MVDYNAIGEEYSRHGFDLSVARIVDFLEKYATNEREKRRFTHRLARIVIDKTLSNRNDMLTHVFLQLANACKKNKALTRRMEKPLDDSVKWLYQSLNSENLSTVYAEVSQYLPSKVKKNISNTLGRLHHTHFRQFLFGEVPSTVINKMKEECKNFSIAAYDRVVRFWRYDASAFENHGLNKSQSSRFEQVTQALHPLASRIESPPYTDCLRRRASESTNQREFLNRLAILLTDAGLGNHHEVIDILIHFYPSDTVLDQLVARECLLYKRGGAVTFLPQYCKNIVSQCLQKGLSQSGTVNAFLKEYLRLLQAFIGQYPGGQLSLFPSSKTEFDPSSLRILTITESHDFTDIIRKEVRGVTPGIFDPTRQCAPPAAGISTTREPPLNIFHP